MSQQLIQSQPQSTFVVATTVVGRSPNAAAQPPKNRHTERDGMIYSFISTGRQFSRQQIALECRQIIKRPQRLELETNGRWWIKITCNEWNFEEEREELVRMINWCITEILREEKVERNFHLSLLKDFCCFLFNKL